MQKLLFVSAAVAQAARGLESHPPPDRSPPSVGKGREPTISPGRTAHRVTR